MESDSIPSEAGTGLGAALLEEVALCWSVAGLTQRLGPLAHTQPPSSITGDRVEMDQLGLPLPGPGLPRCSATALPAHRRATTTGTRRAWARAPQLDRYLCPRPTPGRPSSSRRSLAAGFCTSPTTWGSSEPREDTLHSGLRLDPAGAAVSVLLAPPRAQHMYYGAMGSPAAGSGRSFHKTAPALRG